VHLVGTEGGTAHIPVKRLLVVAVEDLIFTMEEFAHLKECLDCFNQWSAFVKAAAIREEDY
jgi:hypothetical protein